jgi:16S rRNA processing protein RimM
MKKEDCYQLGSIVRLHGFKGEVSILLDVSSPKEYQKLESVYVEINEQLVPFFIQSIQLTNKNFARVQFEGISSEAEAKSIVQCKLFLPLEVLPVLKGNSFYDHEVIGFTVFDEKKGKIGTIRQIIDLPNNPLIEIAHQEIEILVPLRKDTVYKLERNKKEMYIQTPEGLIDLYFTDHIENDED